MSIPDLKKQHIEEALAEIREDGVPGRRGSTKFCLVHGGLHYPPKYVVGLATQHAVGRALKSGEFSGGLETNAVLAALKYDVEPCACGGLMEGGAVDEAARDAETNESED